MKNQSLKSKLLELKEKSNNRLLHYVIDDILRFYKTDEEITSYIKDVLNHGCQSGMVSGLIYHEETHRFTKKYLDEIMEILDEIREQTGEDFCNYGADRLNTLAWLGYEETMRKIAHKLNIEY